VEKCTDCDWVLIIERVLTGFGVLGAAYDYNMLNIAKMSLLQV